MLQNATPLGKSEPWPPNISDEHVFCTAPATQNASFQILFTCPTPAMVFGNATKTLTFCSLLPRCTIPCACHTKRHLNVQKCSVPLGNVLRATTACTFSTSQLPKVVRTPRVFNMLAWKCLRATTARTFSTSQLPKVVRTPGVFNMLTSKCASRHNGVQFFISHLASWLPTRRFSEPTFRPSGATNHWKNTVFRDFPVASHAASTRKGVVESCQDTSEKGRWKEIYINLHADMMEGGEEIFFLQCQCQRNDPGLLDLREQPHALAPIRMGGLGRLHWLLSTCNSAGSSCRGSLPCEGNPKKKRNNQVLVLRDEGLIQEKAAFRSKQCTARMRAHGFVYNSFTLISNHRMTCTPCLRQRQQQHPLGGLYVGRRDVRLGIFKVAISWTREKSHDAREDAYMRGPGFEMERLGCVVVKTWARHRCARAAHGPACRHSVHDFFDRCPRRCCRCCRCWRRLRVRCPIALACPLAVGGEKW